MKYSSLEKVGGGASTCSFWPWTWSSPCMGENLTHETTPLLDWTVTETPPHPNSPHSQFRIGNTPSCSTLAASASISKMYWVFLPSTMTLHPGLLFRVNGSACSVDSELCGIILLRKYYAHIRVTFVLTTTPVTLSKSKYRRSIVRTRSSVSRFCIHREYSPIEA